MLLKRKLFLKHPRFLKKEKGLKRLTGNFLFIFIISLISLLVSGALVAIGIGQVFHYYESTLPPVSIEAADYPGTTRLYDRTGKLIYEDLSKEDRIYVSVEQVSPYFLKAILSAEDQRFFEHQGVDFLAVLRAAWHDIQRKGPYEGASTITQQLARNFFLSPQATLSRKIRETILAGEIEKKYTKKQILEFYLNEIPFGSNIYGVESASRNFFHKSSHDLDLAESAALAVIPRSPSRLFPYTHEKELLAKKDELLRKMAKDKVISSEELKKALSEKLVFEKRPRGIAAPHFTFSALEELKKLYPPAIREKGLDVVTTLDLSLDEKIEKLLANTIKRYQQPYKINDGAVVVLNAKNGDILAMVGSGNFWNKHYGQYNSALAKRQPGSTLKPLIYALAMQDLGWSPRTVLEDKPVDFNGYRPRNFGGGFRGKVSLEAALVNSLNIPAISTLNKLGVKKTVETLNQCNLGLDPKAGLTVAVGGSATDLLDLAASYSIFDNKGKYFPPHYFVRIQQTNGKTFVHHKDDEARQIVSSKAAFQVDSILKRSLSHWSITKSLARDPLLRSARVKTGTSNGPRDLWAIGYNSDIIVGVWLGNNDNSLLRRDVYGLELAVPLWAKAMKITAQYPIEPVSFHKEDLR